MDWRWAWVLGFALIAPAALPAGGADRRQPMVRRRVALEPLLVQESLSLRCAPRRHAPALVCLEQGSTLRLLRKWVAPDGRRWLQVQTASGPGTPRRGWLAG